MMVVRRLVDEDLSGVLVTDEGGLVGVLTERDCIQMAVQAGYFDETGGTVGEYMSHRHRDRGLAGFGDGCRQPVCGIQASSVPRGRRRCSQRHHHAPRRPACLDA